MICLICNLEFENKSKFAAHLQFQHKIKSEDYTIQYLFAGIRPVCLVCGVETRFMIGQYDFQKFCKNHANQARASWSKVNGFGVKVDPKQNLGKNKENCEYMARRSQEMMGNPGLFGEFSEEKKMDARRKGVETYKENKLPHITAERYMQYVADALQEKIKILTPLEDFIDSSQLVDCECLICGEKFQRESSLLRDSRKQQTTGCSKCTLKQVGILNARRFRMSEVDFDKYKIQIKEKQNIEIITPYSEYNSNKQYLKILCHTCGQEREKRLDTLVSGGGCYFCKYKGISSQDREIISILEERGYQVEGHKILTHEGKRIEVDAYLPEYNVAVEHHGLYWHCELEKNDTYHLRKFEICQALGIKLIQVFEDEWRDKQDIVICKKMYRQKFIQRRNSKLLKRESYFGCIKCEFIPSGIILQ